MQANVETTSDLGRKLKVVVPAEVLEKTINERLKKLSTTVKLDGFRPGKVPLEVVKKMYGRAVHDEVVMDELKKSLYEALQAQKLDPAGTPQIENIDAEPGKPLEYTATFEIFPEIKLGDFNKLKIQKVLGEVTEADIDAVIDRIRKQHSEWDLVDRAAKKDDRVVIDLEGRIADKVIEGSVMQDTPLILGSNTFIPGFEEGLIGAKAGDERELSITFPENYKAKELAGKPAKFKVNVKIVAEPRLPEIDAEFAKKLGVKDGDLSALRAQVSKYMEYEMQRAVNMRMKGQVFDKLLEANPVKLPQELLKREVDQLHQQMHEQEGQHAHHHDHGADSHPELLPMAEKRVSLALLLGEVIKKFDIKTDATRVRKHVETLAQTYDNPDQVINWYYSDKKNLAEIEAVTMEDQVIEKILENAQVEEVKENYSKIMLEQAA